MFEDGGAINRAGAIKGAKITTVGGRAVLLLIATYFFGFQDHKAESRTVVTVPYSRI
jgi:hypothetical protein